MERETSDDEAAVVLFDDSLRGDFEIAGVVFDGTAKRRFRGLCRTAVTLFDGRFGFHHSMDVSQRHRRLFRADLPVANFVPAVAAVTILRQITRQHGAKGVSKTFMLVDEHAAAPN